MRVIARSHHELAKLKSHALVGVGDEVRHVGVVGRCGGTLAWCGGSAQGTLAWCGGAVWGRDEVRLRGAVVRRGVRLRGAVVRSGVCLRAWCGGALRGTLAVVRRKVRLCGAAVRRPADSLYGAHRDWRIGDVFLRVLVQRGRWENPTTNSRVAWGRALYHVEHQFPGKHFQFPEKHHQF